MDLVPEEMSGNATIRHMGLMCRLAVRERKMLSGKREGPEWVRRVKEKEWRETPSI